MNGKGSFVIRRALVVPLGLLVVLMVALLVVCVLHGQPAAKIILLLLLSLPVGLLFVECALRRIHIDPDGVTAFRLFRQRRILFADVTSLETVKVRSRVFMTLSAGDDDFIIISNTYPNYPILVELLVSQCPQGAVAEETRLLAEKPVVRHADIFTVWFAVVALVYVLLAQFRH